MGCETGNCPSCAVRIGAMPTPINLGGIDRDWVQTYHLFIVYDEPGRSTVYRGGPARNNRYTDEVAGGFAQLFSAPTRERGYIDMPFGNLVTHRMHGGLERDFDYNAWIDNGAQAGHMITLVEGLNYCGLDAEFTRETRRIGELGRTYNAVHVDRIDNSNATVYTILKNMNLPTRKPAIHAPGWGTDLHTTRNLSELASDAVESATAPIRALREQLRRFEHLSPIDQAQMMRRMFGGY